LGSNEKIAVGTITSIAEPSGTGDATIVGLALARRTDSILKQTKDMDLKVGESSFRETNPANREGIIAPPPLDPLDGLEVIIGGTFTLCKLQMVPSRWFGLGQNMFEELDDLFTPPGNEGSVVGVLIQLQRFRRKAKRWTQKRLWKRWKRLVPKPKQQPQRQNGRKKRLKC